MSRGCGLGRLYDLVPIVIPIDLDTDQAGDQLSLRNCGGVDLIFFTGVGAAGRDLQFTITKHVDMADTVGTTIALGSATALRDYFYKQGSAATAVGVGTWAAGTWFDANGADIVLDAAEGETSSLIVVPIEASDLGDGYSAITVSVKEAGSGAKLGCCIALLRDLEVMRTPANLASALA
jgi:hypothetical protein